MVKPKDKRPNLSLSRVETHHIFLTFRVGIDGSWNFDTSSKTDDVARSHSGFGLILELEQRKDRSDWRIDGDSLLI